MPGKVVLAGVRKTKEEGGLAETTDGEDWRGYAW